MLFRLLSNRAMLAARLAFCCGINHQCAQLLMPRAKNILRCRTPLRRYCTFCLSKRYLVTEKDCMAMVKFCCPCHGTARHAKTKPRPHLNPQRRRHGRGLLRWRGVVNYRCSPSTMAWSSRHQALGAPTTK